MLGFEETLFLLLFSRKREKRELDDKRIQFGIVILTKRVCYYLLLLVNRYFLTNDYYSLISIVHGVVDAKPLSLMVTNVTSQSNSNYQESQIPEIEYGTLRSGSVKY